MKKAVTALVIPVPEADALVGRWRKLYDWSARHGLGSHITLLLPYLSLDDLSATDVSNLKALFGKQKPATFRLTKPQRFLNYLYLAPEPVTLFIRLTRALRERHPQCVPYWGMFDGLVPHLTVAFHRKETVLAKIEESLSSISINARADRVQLMECVSGSWRVVEEFFFDVHDGSSSLG